MRSIGKLLSHRRHLINASASSQMGVSHLAGNGGLYIGCQSRFISSQRVPRLVVFGLSQHFNAYFLPEKNHGRWYSCYPPIFAHLDIKSQRAKVTCPRSPSSGFRRSGFKLRFCLIHSQLATLCYFPNAAR